MSRVVLLVVPAVTLGAVLVGAVLAWWVAVLVALVGGGLAARLLWGLDARRVRRLARTVNGWLGREDHHPVELHGGRHWEELAVAVNALGAAHWRRGQRLQREEPWRRELVDAIMLPAFLFDADCHLSLANELARAQLGLSPGLHLTAMQTLGSRALADAVTAARDHGRTVDVEEELGDRDLWGVATPVGDQVLLLLVDRTEQRRLGEIRRDFVVNASHELKSPVAGIQSLAEALEVVAPSDPDRAGRLAAQVRHESERLGRLVRDLLDLRQLEEGEAAQGRDEVDLVALVGEAQEQLARAAASRDVSVDVDLPGHAVVVGNAHELRLVVTNLLENAVQYNREGGRVTVRVSPGREQAQLVVEDTGIGIPREHLDRIFERFYRVDTSRSRERGGTGLGLSLVRHAVRRHDGEVTVDSLLGEGTTVTVWLPARSRQ